MNDYRHWPSLLREIAEEIGEAEALRVAGAYGGQKITVPRSAAGSTLARTLGPDVAELIVERHPNESIYIPNMALRLAPERRKFILTNPHRSANDLAAALGISSRWVEKVRKNARPDPRQTSLL